MPKKKIEPVVEESTAVTEPVPAAAAPAAEPAPPVAKPAPPAAEKPAAPVPEAIPTPDKPDITSALNSDGTVNLKLLLEAGVHFGHQAQRWNPKMAAYIYAARAGVHIFDLVKTGQKLEEAMNFARQLGKQGQTLVFVGTKRQAQEIIKAQAVQAGAMYIVNRWLGGLLTNWEQVSKSIRRMNQIRVGLTKGDFDHYTKYEKVQLQKDADRLARFFDGISELDQLPDALFIVDVGEESVALKEAKLMKIPMIAVVDTNSNPDGVQHVIPGNDDAVSSITVLTAAVAQAYAEGKKARG